MPESAVVFLGCTPYTGRYQLVLIPLPSRAPAWLSQARIQKDFEGGDAGQIAYYQGPCLPSRRRARPSGGGGRIHRPPPWIRAWGDRQDLDAGRVSWLSSAGRTDPTSTTGSRSGLRLTDGVGGI